MKPASGTRKPYAGASRSLVLALDVGTTFSGVSYAILEPGEVPKIHSVTRFPGQENMAGNTKIPTIMYYDRKGNMKAAGAEADGASVLAQAEDEGWIKTELFKLRLRPKTMVLNMNGMRLSQLPKGKSAVDVFGDFLGYLFRCTRNFIIDTHANGQALWNAVEHDIQFVLSHPNGWEGAQQTKMRRAAVYGGLIPDTDEGRARIRFVTEGEASLHACVLNGLAADVLSNPASHGFIVADAGGGTLDISSYAIKGTHPLVIEEIAPPDCVFAGSVFVSRRARAFFAEKLKNSKYGTPDALEHITKRFDETTKRLFRGMEGPQFVHFGSPLDRDPAAGVINGQLRLSKDEVAALFEPSIQAAEASIRNQVQTSGGLIKSVWLVGGFAASPWLFSQLQNRLKPLGVTVSQPDNQTSKAVANGAVGFYCDHHVSARVSKFMYGVEYLREFDSTDEEHVARQHRLFELPSGPKLLPDAFDCILSRNVKVKESTVFSRKYCTEVTNLTTLSVFEVEIWCYRGGDTIPKWILRDAEHFSTLCYVRADLSPLASSAQPKESRNGKKYWTIVFSIEIHFGLTEFRARIKWQDNGRTRYGPASIVYNERGHRADEDEPDSLPDDDLTAHGHRSHVSSRAPSKPATPPTYTAPHSRRQSMDRTYERDPSRIYDMRDRKGSLTSSSDNWRDRERQSTQRDKGKSREIPSDLPSRLSERDRSVNLSATSTDSKASARTARLSDQLASNWGPSSSASPSQQTTPSASTAAEVPSLNVATPKETKPPSPVMTPKVSTPQPVASKVATPKPAASSHATSKAASRVPTPRVTTPRAVSRAPTADGAAVGTPQPAPKSVSVWGASKAATPASASKVPTPAISKAPSKAPTRRSSAKAETPTTARSDPLAEVKSLTPKVGPVLPPEDPAPLAPGPPASEPAVEAPVEQQPEPASSPTPAVGTVAEQTTDEPPTSATAPAEVSAAQPTTEPVVTASDANANKSGGSFGDWVDVTVSGDTGAVNAGSAEQEQLSHSFIDHTLTSDPPAGNGGLEDLWGADKQEETGGFSDFLSSKEWGQGGNTPPEGKKENKAEEKKDPVGGGDWGVGQSFNSASRSVFGSASGWGLPAISTPSAFGSAWGPSSGDSRPSAFSGTADPTVDNPLVSGGTQESRETEEPKEKGKDEAELSQPLKLDLSSVPLEVTASGATPGTEGPSAPATPGGEFTATGARKKKKKGKGKNAWPDEDEDKSKAEQEAREKAEQETWDKAEQEAQEKAEQEAKEKAEKESKEQADKEAQEKAEKEKQEQEAKDAEEKRKEEEEAKKAADEAAAATASAPLVDPATETKDESAQDADGGGEDKKEDGDEDVDEDGDGKAGGPITPTVSGTTGGKKNNKKKKKRGK